MARTLHYTRPDGQTVNGYLAEPANATDRTPGIVVIQEWWGLNDQIRGVADRLASAGYRALVPDLYRGQSTVEAEEAHHLMDGLNFGEAAAQDIRGAVLHLKQGGARVGVTGFCMGGALTLLALTQSPEIDAGVVWYGCPLLDFVDASRITAPVMGHFAIQDQFFPLSQIEGLEAKLQAAGVRYEGHHYLAHHAFANETATGPRRLPATQYDPAWAQLAWDRSLRFFGRELG